MTVHPLIFRLAGSPSLLMPGSEARVSPLAGLPHGGPPERAALISEAQSAGTRPYEMIGGVAVIYVAGVLLADIDWIDPWGWVTGYPVLRYQLGAALDDDEVQAVALVIDSPGGEVAGCEELADWLYAQRGAKPVVAIVNSLAASAAYWIASATDMVVMPRTGLVGSIGVVALHVDMSKMLAEWGVKVTLIHHGARKVDGHPYGPLNDGARAAWQGHVDRIGSLFAGQVARNRGLDVDAVLKLEAGIFDGTGDEQSQAIQVGLADAVAPADEALHQLTAALAPAA